MAETSQGHADIQKPQLELVKLAVDSVGLGLNFFFYTLCFLV